MTKEYKAKLSEKLSNLLQKYYIQNTELINLIAFMVSNNMTDHPQYSKYNNELLEITDKIINLKAQINKYTQNYICKSNQQLLSWRLQFDTCILIYTVKED